MARTQQQQFSTIRTEGALLPPDILQQIASGKVEGLRPADYHLPEGYKLNEAMTQSWDLLKKHWKTFQEARANLSDTDTGTEITNKHWLLPLFRELDYGHLATSPAPQIEDRSYPIERFYNHTPIHLVGCNLPLDRRTKGARGAATASPHSMVQEFLNRSEGHVWAIVTNGLRLRLLRDNVALSRQAFVEFDLEAMMEGEVYPDFALLWLLLHQSRVETPKADDCWLEAWSKLARESGTRILKQLRESVRTAIEALGQGFVSHVQNDALREKLRSGSLSRDDYYRQLLRIVYRLLFLFVAEDRDLLHPPGTSDTTRDRYRRFYSLSRLRDMALKLRGSKHGDLWHGLSLVFNALGSPDGCPTLGLSCLGSFLWSPEKTPDLNGPHEAADGRAAVQIANDDLLPAIHALAYVEQDRILRSVDYRNLGSEELGSVYESLLELHPDIEIDAQRFSLATAAGNQRKISGSYYTPDSLVQCLLDSALDPVVEDRIKGKKGPDAEAAILELTVCDPACGSGHFLIAAAHRLARHVARIRTGESEPSPDDHQTALRDVISRCIYGVDLNPMAVELCKVSLWMEAIEPGKPLSFLDHHVKCGNSLLGVTPRLLREGIPEDAFKAIEGDDKDVVKDLKKRHKQELKDRTGGVQSYLFAPYLKLGKLGEEFVRVTTDSSDTAADVARKASLYADLVGRADYLNAQLLADTWCSAFVWKKDKTDLGKACPTERDFRECETNPHSLLPHVRTEVARLADEFSFFHWHLAFPEVFHVPTDGQQPENHHAGWNSGFTVMLGNPPWEKVKLQEREFFAVHDPEIANARTAAVRKRLINAHKKEQTSVWTMYLSALQQITRSAALIRESGGYPFTSGGDLNTYSVFAELVVSMTASKGRAGQVLKTGIVNAKENADFFAYLISTHRLASVRDFKNWKRWFPDVGYHERFSLVTFSGAGESPQCIYAFNSIELRDAYDPQRTYSLTRADIELINPNVPVCPVFSSGADASLTRLAYRHFPPLVRERTADNPWGVQYFRMFDMTNDSDAFTSLEELETLGDFSEHSPSGPHAGTAHRALLEGKHVHCFTHRFATFEGIPASKRFGIKAATHRPTPMQLANPLYEPLPRYWVTEEKWRDTCPESIQATGWCFSFRDVTNVISNARSTMMAACPPVAFGNSAALLSLENRDIPPSLFLSVANSFAFDYFTRQKLFGAHLNKYILWQLPFPPPSLFSDWPLTPTVSVAGVTKCANELSYTAASLNAYATACGISHAPYRWNSRRRTQLRSEIDAAYFHLFFGSPRDWQEDAAEVASHLHSPRAAVEYVLDSFPIVKQREIEHFQSYRTKERILAIYDEMAECIAKGTEWVSPLDPPPGDPRAAWTEEEMEMWRQGKGDELIAKYGLLDDADEPDDSDADSESDDPADAEALE